MSTRANIVIKEGSEILYYYRHSDGYPQGTMPTLLKLCELIALGAIRGNISQCSGHLIVIGALEYAYHDLTVEVSDYYPKNWKVGAYEPTTCLHGDIEWLYIIDLEESAITQAHYETEAFKKLYDEHQVKS